MIQKLFNPIILFVVVGAFLGYFIVPELLLSIFKINLDRGAGAVIGGALGYFFGKYI